MSFSSDSEDDTLLEQICHYVTTDMDSVFSKYPSLLGLSELPESSPNDAETTEQFNYTPDEFRNQFQMSQRCFSDLMSKIGATSNIRNLKKKLLFTLSMLETQESFDTVGKRFGFSKSSGHACFKEILDAILSLFADYVKWPSVNEYMELSQAFKEKSGGCIPGIIGAISACHLEIKQPKENAEEYHNTNDTYSIILQAVCDNRMIFTDVYVGSPGSLNNNEVFKDSNLFAQLNTLVPGEYHMVGDSSYPLIRNLITPFPDNGHLSKEKLQFNTIISNIGVTIERAFSILRGRFKKLKYLDTIKPDLANKIVCSCITIHNHIRMHDVDEDEDEFMETPVLPSIYIDGAPEPKQERSKAGHHKRNYLMSLCE